MGCNDLISDEDIENIYQDNSLILRNEVVSSCKNDNNKQATIHIYDKDNLHMCEGGRIGAIIRKYQRNSHFFSPSLSDTGKVVTHEQFLLRPQYRRKTIIKTIHAKEIEIYKRLGFQEIQLEAEFDGLVVWKKMLFKFKEDINLNFIKIAIQKYLSEIKGLSNKDIASIVKSNPFNIQVEYLKGNNPEQDFSNWIYNEYPGMGTIYMYKELI